MSGEEFIGRVRTLIANPMPLPGGGKTALRHRRLMDVGREDLSVARLVEAHCDAVAILAEAGRQAEPAALYGVWASEKPGTAMQVEQTGGELRISGEKAFLSGAGLVDRALLTTGGEEPLLLDLDLRANAGRVQFDYAGWKATAFQATCTGVGKFQGVRAGLDAVVGEPNWYVERAGFWHGACGPAACWAGGAAGLLDFALRQKRDDPHTLAHLGAMRAEVWALEVFLDAAGREIDADRGKPGEGRVRALTVRHLVEQACTDVLRRLPRAYGPQPLAMDEDVLRRYEELDLYLRQSHAERDLEELGIGALRIDAKPSA